MRILSATVTGMKVKKDVMVKKAAANFCTVTELANFLVRIDGFSFRAAHEIVADVVEYMLVHGLKANEIDRKILNKITQKLFKKDSKMSESDIKDALDPARSVSLRAVEGGSAPKEVKRQLGILEANLKANKKTLANREKAVEKALAACDAEVAKLLKK